MFLALEENRVARKTEDRGDWKKRERRCVNCLAHSRCSICIHSLPKEGAESQKGQEMNREGRKESGKESVVRGDNINFLAHSRCSVNASSFPGETRQIRKK